MKNSFLKTLKKGDKFIGFDGKPLTVKYFSVKNGGQYSTYQEASKNVIGNGIIMVTSEEYPGGGFDCDAIKFT